MKKLLFFLLLSIGAIAARAQNPWDTNFITFDAVLNPVGYRMAAPASDAFLVYDITAHRFVAKLPGFGLTIDPTTKDPKVDITAFATVALTGDYNDLTNKPAGASARVFNNPTRSLNTAFQASTTRDAIVSYTVDIGATLTLLAGQTGTVILEYADDSAITTNVKTVASTANGNTGALTIGLNLTQTSTASLSGVVPANKWIRIRTVNTAGTPAFTYRTAQEVLL